MTRTSELVELVYREIGCTRKQANSIINCFVALIVESLCNGEDVRLEGLGSLKIKQVPERSYLLQGKEMISPAHSRVTFSPMPKLKEKVRDL